MNHHHWRSLPQNFDNPELDDKWDTFLTTYVRLLGFTILVWDHMITFADEVEFVWKEPKKLMAYLFLFNRYFTPAAYIVFLASYISPTLSVTEFVPFACLSHLYHIFTGVKNSSRSKAPCF